MKVEEEDEEMAASSPSKRPKRQTSGRSTSSENGLLWREEKELKKALYASLQESSRVRPNARGQPTDAPPASQQPTVKRPQEADQSFPKKAKVHAQRKFAQGSLPNSPVSTPVRMGRHVQGLTSLETVFHPCKTRPKTEDFLTFLCLRGTRALPPNLEFFNHCWPNNNGSGDADSDCSEKSYYSEEHMISGDGKTLLENGCWVTEGGERTKLTANEIAAYHRQPSAKITAVKRKLVTGSSCQISGSVSKKGKVEQKKGQSQNKPKDKSKRSQVSSSVAKRAKALKEKYRRLDNQQQIKKITPVPEKRCTRGTVPLKNTRSSSLLSNIIEQTKSQKIAKKRILEACLKRAKVKKTSLRSPSQRLCTVPNSGSGKGHVRQVPRKAKLVPTIVEVDSEEDFENVLLTTRSRRSSAPHPLSDQVKKPNKRESSKPAESETKRKETAKKGEERELPLRRVQRDSNRTVAKGKCVIARTVLHQNRTGKGVDVRRVTRSQGHVPETKSQLVTKPMTVRVHRMRLERTASTVTEARRQLFVMKDHRKGKTKTTLPAGNIRRIRSMGVKHSVPQLPKPIKKEVTPISPATLRKIAGDQMVAKKSAFVRVRGYKHSIITQSAKQKAMQSKASSKVTRSKSMVKKASPDNNNVSKMEQNTSSSGGQLLSTPDRQGAAMMATIAGSSNDLPTALDQDMMPMMLSSEEEIQGLMTRKFSGVFDDAFPTNALLLSSPQSGSGVPSGGPSAVAARCGSNAESTIDDATTLVIVDDGSPSKSVVDASTNTCEEDILLATGALPLKVDEPIIDEDDIPVAQLLKTVMPVLKTPEKQSRPSLPTSVVTPPAKTSNTAKQKPVPAKKSKTSKSGKASSLCNIAKKKEAFPSGQGAAAKMVEAPLYAPTAEEFQDPLEFIRKVQQEAAPYGICRIIPPSTFKPECKLNDEMRFTALNQHVHKMLYRWGPNVQQRTCIRKHLSSQGIMLNQAPLIGGMELDLVRLYRTVQSFGGLQLVDEKKKWQRIADTMHIPKTAQDRVNRLYDAYCKYLVAYDTLPKDEKDRLEEEIRVSYENHQRITSSLDQPESGSTETPPSQAPVLVKVESKEKSSTEPNDGYLEEEEMMSNDCVIKGRTMSLSSFYRIARNTHAMWCKRHTAPEEIERDYWKLVTERQYHVVVHAGNMDSSVYGSGFSSSRSSIFCKHPWNLKVLTNNAGTLLRAMGPVSGITIPTLHLGMLYTTGCWHKDPHALPWIEYLHTGAPKIWYGVPRESSDCFRRAMQEIMPSVCAGGKPLWLPSDTAMVPPSLLVDHGSSLSRTVQENGQFVVIFPGTFVSSICTGYTISESVYFAPQDWLLSAKSAFQSIRSSCEPAAFSLERLLFCLAEDARTQLETLQLLHPWLQNIRDQDARLRAELSELGVTSSERLPRPQEFRDKRKRSRGFKLGQQDDGDNECDVCRVQCYISKVVHREEECLYCLEHAIQVIRSRGSSTGFRLAYSYHQDELEQMVKEVGQQMQVLSSKKKTKKSGSP